MRTQITAALLVSLVSSISSAQAEVKPIHTMTVGDLSIRLNMPEALPRRFDSNGKEIAQSIPPYRPSNVLSAVNFNTPAGWNLGSRRHSVYFTTPNFVAGKDRVGMWLDMTGNEGLSHYVAAVIDVQGLNPITGVKANPKMEKYDEVGPDGQPVLSEGYSPSLGYKLPPQNYLTTSNDRMWLDGWMAEPGVTRQFVFSKNGSAGTGVAEQLLGNDRKFAITVTFYKSKQAKPPRVASGRTGRMRSAAPSSTEVGAGAMLNQKIDMDTNALDFWDSKPAGQITIYLVNDADLRTIARSPRKIAKGYLDAVKTATGDKDWDPLQNNN